MSFSESQYVIQKLSKKIETSLNLQGQIDNLKDNESKLIIASQTEPLNQPIGGLWFFLNDDNETVSYKIKGEEGYSDPFIFSVNSSNVKIGDTNLSEILNNSGNTIYVSHSESTNTSKEVVCDTFLPQDGSKILVAFDNNNTQPVVSLVIYNSEGRLITSGECYKDLDNFLEGKKLVKNTVFQFLYQSGKFICLGGGSSSIASNTLPGGVLSGGDITVNQDTGMVTVNQSEKANLDREGNVITPNNHASSEPMYGLGNDSVFGHIKVAGVEYEGDTTSVSGSIVDVKENRKRVEVIENELPTKKEENWIINGGINYDETGFVYGWFIDTSSEYSIEEKTFSLKNGSIYQKIDISSANNDEVFDLRISIGEYIKEESVETNPKISVYDCLQDGSENLINELEIIEVGEKQLSFNKSDIGDKVKVVISTAEKILIKNVRMFPRIENISPLSRELEKNFSSSLDGDKNLFYRAKDNNLLINGNFGLTKKGIYQVTDNYLYKDGWIFRYYGNNEQFKGFTFKENQGGVFFNYRNGDIIYTQQIFHEVNSLRIKDNPLYLTVSIKLSMDDASLIKDYLSLTLVPYDKDDKMLTQDGEITSDSSNCPNTSFISEEGFMKITAKIPTNCSKIKWSFEIKNCTGLEDSVEVNIHYAKLEVGTNSTPYYPRSYIEEIVRLEKLDEKNFYNSLKENVVQSNPNLIINPNFKINQRNFDEENFNCSSTNKEYYCDDVLEQSFGVDRWMMDNNMKQQLVYDENGEFDCFKISFVRWVGICGSFFRQFIDNPKKYLNKTLTLSVCSKTSSSLIRCQLVGITTDNKEIKSDTISLNTTATPTVQSVSLEINEELSYLYVDIYPTNKGQQCSYLVDGRILYVKLEEGKEATPFIEPDLNEELAKCQNYFQIMKVKEVKSDYLLSGTNYNLRTFNLPSSLRGTPFITMKSGKYDNLYVDTTNNFVPSTAYKIYSRSQNNFVFGYKSAGGAITTSTKKYKDLNYGLKDFYNQTTFTTNDFETSVDSSLQTILGTSAKNSYFHARELDITFLCDAEIRINPLKKLKYWCSNPPSNSYGNWTVTSSNNYSNAFKGFRDDTGENYYWYVKSSTTQSLTINFGWSGTQGYPFYGCYFCMKNASKATGKINIYTTLNNGSTDNWTLVGSSSLDVTGNWVSRVLKNVNNPTTAAKIKIEIVPDSGQTPDIYLNRFYLLTT